MMLTSAFVFVAFLELGSGISCYSCVNWYIDFVPALYDPECGVDGYDNHINTIDDLNSNTCATEVFFQTNPYRRVLRGSNIEDQPEEECTFTARSVSCYCNTDYCNSGLCSHCYNQTLI
ncbi:unnamed protein product [Meganyctiphanes norvegica]|uniref:Protein sleepless n=1 Tax=Meganyctiphanes norvegica TaxID=48144 RepID=A0AAV2R5N8_MEGNR